jgi:acetyltransferase
LLDSARQHRPDAVIQGVLVSPMAKKGVEIIVGTMLDATFGPMIMVGLGGITTELFKDVIYRPAPVSAEEAAGMLAELKAAPLLNGFRGAAKADIAALSQLISQISALAAGSRDHISEIEINPVLVHPEGQGVTIVDALVVPKKI